MHSAFIGLKYTADQPQNELYSTSFEINDVLKKVHSEHIYKSYDRIWNGAQSVFCSGQALSNVVLFWLI